LVCNSVMGFSNRIIVFLLGLSVGLLIGAGFFIFKIDDYLSKIEFFKSSPDTVRVITQTKSEESKKGQYPLRVSGKNPVKVSADTARTAADSSLAGLPVDSLASDTTVVFTGSPDEIVVKKDELLSVRNIDVVSYAAESKSPKDSILQKESGIKDDKTFAAFKVEFWQSPINYKGYKMSKNKIVLFGIGQDETLKIYRVDDAFYMKHQQNVYRLDFTNDFRQFESVKDQTLLARLK